VKKRATIKDVATQAGLSQSTVSLVINNRGYVSETTRKKILDVVAKLSYHPSRSARGLASKTSGNIGFILTDDHFSQAEPFYTKIFLGTEFEARNLNYYILLTTVGKQFTAKSPIPRFLLERNVDGVIIAGKIHEALVDHIVSLGLPVVIVDYQLPRRRISSVLIDNRRGAHEAALHLIEGGHKSIAFIGGDLEHPSIAERFASYKDTLTDHGIAINDDLIDVTEADTQIDNGSRAMERLLRSATRPTAVFAANDAMAFGCVRSIKQAGLRIPRDIAVVGFDDVDMSSHMEPRLTTVRVFKEEMGKLAVQRIVDLIDSKSESVVTTHVPVEFVVRDSSVLTD
jgi:LacI family transcriptional regulator